MWKQGARGLDVGIVGGGNTYTRMTPKNIIFLEV
jgi:hypothetical protein